MNSDNSVLSNPVRLLGSLKLSVVLLVALLAALAAGTIVESADSTEAARRLVYGAFWFRLLLTGLAVNTFFALAQRWPPTRVRAGFFLTHTAFLLILVGALATELGTTEGRLALWEGETGQQLQTASGAPVVLPFAVRLDSFEIDTYPGTQRPAMFRSRVTVQDPVAGAFPAVIQMNQELSHGGWKLFQSSYQIAGGREMTVLSVSKDPGQPIVFLGYALLLVGMGVVLATRIRQARLRRRLEEERNARKVMPPPRRQPAKDAAKAAALLLAAVLAAGATVAAAAPAFQAPLPDDATVARVRTLAVQHDGRVMPLDTLAREAAWKITGDEHFRGADPVALVLGWTFQPDAWAGEPVVRVGGDDLASVAGLPAATDHASFRQLVGSAELLGLMREARARGQREEPPGPLDEDALELEDRLVRMQAFLNRGMLRTTPRSADPNQQWALLPPSVGSAGELAAWADVLRAQPPAGYPAFAGLATELTYNRVQPSRLAWWLLVPATLLALAALWWRRRWLDVLATAGLVAGFAVMTWGIATRWDIAGRIPAANMYESMLFLGWGIGLFALVAAALLKNRLIIFNAAAMAALTMALVDLLPVDPFIHPMPPVLSGTPWLAIHVPIIMVSYSVLALGVLIAHLQIGVEMFRPDKRDTVEHLNGLLYWYMHVGSILLAAGIITGSVWAASSWGRYWGWDPKEVWSLIAFLAYMAILHSRFDRQIGAFGVAAASIVAFWTVLMTYLGVNFVLSAGLHSYGFGSGGLVSWMAGIGALEIVFLAAGYVAHRRNVAENGPLFAGG